MFISPEHLDALQELLNIGGGRAAGSLIGKTQEIAHSLYSIGEN